MAVVQELTERYADRPGKGFVKNKIASRISLEELRKVPGFIRTTTEGVVFDTLKNAKNFADGSVLENAKKQAIREEKARRLKKRQEIEEMVKIGFTTIAVIIFIAVAVGVTFKFFVSIGQPIMAHNNHQDDNSCMIYEPKYFYICMNEGREWADTELFLDYKKIRGNWIEIEDDK